MLKRSNEPADLLERFAVIWRETSTENLRAAYRLSQHIDGAHDTLANESCLGCQEDQKDV